MSRSTRLHRVLGAVLALTVGLGPVAAQAQPVDEEPRAPGVALPAEPDFMKVCMDLPAAMQRCLQLDYAIEHAIECRKAGDATPMAQRQAFRALFEPPAAAGASDQDHAQGEPAAAPAHAAQPSDTAAPAGAPRTPAAHPR